MITEDYVSFEIARLLKEKGMDISCFNHYVQKNNNDGTSEAVTVCTLQKAMKWLREVHNVHIDVHLSFSEDPENYPPSYYVYLLDSKSGNSILEKAKTIDKLNPLMDINKNNTPIRFDSYEEACEEAIRYCLENLI